MVPSHWVDEPLDGVSVIVELCRGRRVLDIGCGQHDSMAVDGRARLHERIAAVAADAVAMDLELNGIERMRAAGYIGLCASVPKSHWSAADTPFDVVVADEVIEHLTAPSSLLEFARQRLQPGGALVLTTPNPYAIGRGRGRRLLRENAAHVTYLFPSGVTALAERVGFIVRTSTTVDFDRPRSHLTTPAERSGRSVALKGAQLGETAVYVLEKPA